MEYNIISGDSHIDFWWLPHDLFTSTVSAKWKDKVPQVVETKEGRSWFAEGKDLGYFYSLARLQPPERGVSKHTDRMFEVGFFNGPSHPTTPELSIKDQEIDGVWPDSREIIEDDLGRLDERVRRKITRDNAGKLYGVLN